jgi:hypothetical protein
MKFDDFVRNFQLASDKQMAQFEKSLADLSRKLPNQTVKRRRLQRRRKKVQGLLRDA